MSCHLELLWKTKSTTNPNIKASDQLVNHFKVSTKDKRKSKKNSHPKWNNTSILNRMKFQRTWTNICLDTESRKTFQVLSFYVCKCEGINLQQKKTFILKEGPHLHLWFPFIHLCGQPPASGYRLPPTTISLIWDSEKLWIEMRH